MDLAYDVEAGTYDLTIHQEGRGDPLVALVRQKNVASQPGSAVDKFSFVGQPSGDESEVTYNHSYALIYHHLCALDLF